MAAFERGHQLFERRVRRVVVARVAVALLLLAEDAVELLHGLVEVAGGRVDRGGDRDVRGRASCGRPRARLWCESSTSISSSSARRPWCLPERCPAPGAARGSGRRARNSRAFLAAVRSAISASTSASAELAGLRAGLAARRRRSRSGSRKSSAAARIAGAELARIHGAVGVAHVFEDRGQRLGGVQVVVQAVAECLRRPRRCAPASCSFDALGEAVGFQAQLEIAQALDGGGGRFQPVEGEVERLAIGHRGQQVADGLRRDSRGPAGRAG